MVKVIAEIGINHQGNLELAKRMIEESHRWGADIAKFQMYDPEKVLGRDSPHLAEAKQAQFDKKQHLDLKKYCDKIGIEYGCSVFHPEDVKFFEDIGLARYKIASRSAKDLPLLESVAETEKPVLMSCGMASPSDIINAKNILSSSDLSLLYCVCNYPTDLKDLNLGRMVLLGGHMKDVGFSSHCPSIAPTLTAVAYGATVVENHVVFDRTQKGCDVASSLTFRQFGQMVPLIREMELMQ